ncbi:MAG: SDR family oxidoreductase [Candidatus Sericytochromatia bacterium]
MSNIDLTNKTALVCGASKGIGKAIAEKLAEANANVILLARTEEKLIEISKNLKGNGNHSFISSDIANFELIKVKINEYISKNGNIHILINNTGGPKAGPIEKAEGDEFIEAFKNHVLSCSELSKLVLDGMRQENYGRIINIISTSVKIPIPNLGVSNTIRAAVASWSKTLSLEVAKFGITVNNVLPGYTETERLDILIENAAKNQNKTKEQVIYDWKNTIPSRRFASPEEIANAALFLASPLASYINGINLPVDGGRTGCL